VLPGQGLSASRDWIVDDWMETDNRITAAESAAARGDSEAAGERREERSVAFDYCHEAQFLTYDE